MSVTVATTKTPQLPVDDLPKTITYSGDFVRTITVEYQGTTYVKTFTNNGSNITAISRWVAQ